MRQSLSVCAIVKNEENYLPAMLESIRSLADETIIVDTGSQDRTVEIARSFGASVFNYPWHDNFSAARNFAAEQASGDWIFILDADEVLLYPENIRKYLDAPLNTLYMLKVIHFSNSRDINVNTGVHSNARLFPNKQGFAYSGAVHEHIIQTRDIEINRVLIADAEIRHYGFSEFETDLKGKNERNIRILEHEIAGRSYDSYYFYQHFLLGKEYLGLKNYSKAKACFYKCLEMPSIEENFLINTVTYLLKIFSIRQDWKRLEIYCKKYAYCCYKNPDFCFIYGVFLSEIKRKNNEANFYFSKALEFKPENHPYLIYDQGSINWKPLLFLGINSMARGDYLAACQYLEKALVFTDGIWQIQYNLIKSYIFLKQAEKARNLFSDCAGIFPPDILKELEAEINR